MALYLYQSIVFLPFIMLCVSINYVFTFYPKTDRLYGSMSLSINWFLLFIMLCVSVKYLITFYLKPGRVQSSMPL
jgi:hypothetical protein